MSDKWECCPHCPQEGVQTTTAYLSRRASAMIAIHPTVFTTTIVVKPRILSHTLRRGRCISSSYSKAYGSTGSGQERLVCRIPYPSTTPVSSQLVAIPVGCGRSSMVTPCVVKLWSKIGDNFLTAGAGWPHNRELLPSRSSEQRTAAVQFWQDRSDISVESPVSCSVI